MSSDLDTLGYLLAAIVFSVSLLVSRTQESAENAKRNATDASWRLTDRIGRGETVAFADLSSALSNFSESRDWTREVTRWVNGGLFLAILVAFFDAERTSLGSTGHFADSSLLAILLVASAALVFALGEFHNIYWSQRSKRDIHTTLVGQLLDLERLVLVGDSQKAREVVDSLEAQYPHWSFVDEMRCRIAYLEHDDDGAIRLGEAVFDEEEYSYSAALVIAAASIRSDIPHRAIEIFDMAENRNKRERIELYRAVGLLAANLDCLIEEDPGKAHEMVKLRSSPLGGDWRRSEAGTTYHSALDFTWEDFEELRFASEIYHAWHSDETLPIRLFQSMEPLKFVVDTVGPAGVDAKKFDAFVEWTRGTDSAFGLEVAGVIGLAIDRPSVAYDLLERASATNPASSRIHLLMAIAALRVNWHDKAITALSNSALLGGLNSAVYELGRARILGMDGHERAADPSEFGINHRNETILLAALMGLDLSEHFGMSARKTTAAHFLQNVCECSLTRVDVGAPRV